MRSLDFSRYAPIGVAAAMLAGCGGSQPPIGAPSAMPQTSGLATHAEHGKSWMLPEAKTGDLLYVTDAGKSNVFVFSYPQGKLVGSLTGSFSNPAGECVDVKGDVWITNPDYTGSGFIVEYAHGGSAPIAILQEPGASPVGCSIDPSSGDLAVANTSGVAVFQNAQGKPTTYTSSGFSRYYACAYDDSGNLFADGNATGLIVELPRGGATLEGINLNQSIAPASLQWDGARFAVVTFGHLNQPRQLYRIQVNGSIGTVTGPTPLKSPGSKSVTSFQQYWVEGKRVIGPDRYRRGGAGAPAILTWKYPRGGEPLNAIKRLFTEPWGTAVSSPTT